MVVKVEQGGVRLFWSWNVGSRCFGAEKRFLEMIIMNSFLDGFRLSWFHLDTLSLVLALSPFRLARAWRLGAAHMISFSAFALFLLHSYYSVYYPEYQYHYSVPIRVPDIIIAIQHSRERGYC